MDHQGNARHTIYIIQYTIGIILYVSHEHHTNIIDFYQSGTEEQLIVKVRIFIVLPDPWTVKYTLSFLAVEQFHIKIYILRHLRRLLFSPGSRHD